MGRVVSPQMRLPNVRITAENRAQLVPLAINTLRAYGAMCLPLRLKASGNRAGGGSAAG